MDIDIFVYYTDGEHDFCFGCAVKEIIKRPGKEIDVEVRDHSYDGCDMRSDPECYICSRRAEHHVIA